VTWNNGDPFTASDVAFNFERWADGTVEGNSMATRVGALMDPETNMLAEGAVEVVDDHTLSPEPATARTSRSWRRCRTSRPRLFTQLHDGGDPSDGTPIGTGAYLPEVKRDRRAPGAGAQSRTTTTGGRAVGSTASSSSISAPTSPLSVVGADAGEIDLTYRTDGDFVDVFDAIGWERTEVVTAATIALRFNQRNAPYDNPDVRRAHRHWRSITATDHRRSQSAGSA
jgi:peptide/nickel transport system substrate-binding protein